MTFVSKLLSGLRGWPPSKDALPLSITEDATHRADAEFIEDIVEDVYAVLFIGERERDDKSVAATFGLCSEGEIELMAVSRLAQGLQIFRNRAVDAIVLEITDGSDAGLARLDYVKAWEPRCPVIVVAHQASERDLLRIMRAGATDCWVMTEPSVLGLQARIHGALVRADHAARSRGEEPGALRPLTIVQEADEGILIVDRDGTIRFANDAAARILRKPQTELIGRAFPYSLKSDGAQEIAIAHADGGQTVTDMRVIETEWGGYPARLASLHDVTVRKLLERTIEDTDAKRRLSAELLTGITDMIRTRFIPKLEAVAEDARAGRLAETAGAEQASFAAIAEDMTRAAGELDAKLGRLPRPEQTLLRRAS